jgi:hypothetical protein
VALSILRRLNRFQPGEFHQSIVRPGVNHPGGKKMLKISKLEHVPIGKVMQLFRNVL